MIDHHRTKKPVVALEAAHDLGDEAPLPESAAEAAQEHVRLLSALDRLKPNLRRVILCRFVNGLSHAQTAEVMGIREGHVRVLQYRALKGLRAFLLEETD